MPCRCAKLFQICLSILLLLSCRPPVSAQQLQFTLDNANPTVVSGGTFQFFATLLNLDNANSLSLDSSSFTFNTADATLTDNFLNTPPFLNPQGQGGDSWTGDLFDVSVNAGVLGRIRQL